MSRTAGDEGFTLVEMLVVLSLVGLLLAISLPYARNSGSARKLDAIAQTVAAKLRDTRTAALSGNHESVLTIDVKTGALTQPGSDKSFDLPASIAVQVVTAANEIVEGAGSMRFFPDGGSTGGKIVLTEGSDRREIAISWLTGAIVVSSDAPP